MAIAIIPILMIVIGVLIYVLTAKAEAKEFGRSMFWAGWVGIAIGYASKMVHFG